MNARARVTSLGALGVVLCCRRASMLRTVLDRIQVLRFDPLSLGACGDLDSVCARRG